MKDKTRLLLNLKSITTISLTLLLCMISTGILAQEKEYNWSIAAGIGFGGYTTMYRDYSTNLVPIGLREFGTLVLERKLSQKFYLPIGISGNYYKRNFKKG